MSLFGISNGLLREEKGPGGYAKLTTAEERVRGYTEQLYPTCFNIVYFVSHSESFGVNCYIKISLSSHLSSVLFELEQPKHSGLYVD